MKRKSADVNWRAECILYRLSGDGYESLASFCSIMNMPCLSKRAYYHHLKAIVDALELETKQHMKQAAQRLRQRILKENGRKGIDALVDAVVSFNGTWAKRGFTSLTGVICYSYGHWRSSRLPIDLQSLSAMCSKKSTVQIR